MDAQTRREIEGLKAIIRDLKREQRRSSAGSRTPQLGHSSIDAGRSLDVRDEAGATRLSLGWQPDGQPALVAVGGDPPPVPTAPSVAAAPVGLMVGWDGALVETEDGEPEEEPAEEPPLPSNFDHVSVHVSASSGFTPDASTFVGTIPRAGGVLPVMPLEAGQTYYVVLVGVTTGGVEGAPSAEVAGVPDGVGGVPEPGSITETEIADDAISTPKLQALAVTAAKVAANAIEAGHITAGAVTAAKLAATLVLASRLVAGNPAADRVELDGDGLRGYDDGGELIFAVQGGSAAFTGAITGSDIVGSTLRVGDLTGDHIRIGAPDAGAGYAVTAHGGGSRIEIRASSSAAEVRLTPPPNGEEAFFDGFQYAYLINASGSVVPAVNYSSPYTEAILPAGPRTEIQLEGSSETVDAVRNRHRADVHHFSLGARTHYARGVVEIDPELSIRSRCHQFEQTVLAAQPTGSANNGTWTDFSNAQFPPIEFTTGHSGRVRIVIAMVGVNNFTPGATLSTGFRLSGAGTLAADVSRAAMVRSFAARGSENHYAAQQTSTVYLALSGASTYVLTPAWRATGASAAWGATGTALHYDPAYTTAITVEPLM